MSKGIQNFKNKLRQADRIYDNFDTSISLNNFSTELIQKKLNNIKGIGLPDGFVPYTEYWIIDNDGFAGKISLRHILPSKFVGHIGIHIIPSKRGIGYGSKALRLALNKAKQIGLNELMITCDKDNIASKRTIIGVMNEYGGKDIGELENNEGIIKSRFMINTEK